MSGAKDSNVKLVLPITFSAGEVRIHLDDESEYFRAIVEALKYFYTKHATHMNPFEDASKKVQLKCFIENAIREVLSAEEEQTADNVSPALPVSYLNQLREKLISALRAIVFLECKQSDAFRFVDHWPDLEETLRSSIKGLIHALQQSVAEWKRLPYYVDIEAPAQAYSRILDLGNPDSTPPTLWLQKLSIGSPGFPSIPDKFLQALLTRGTMLWHSLTSVALYYTPELNHSMLRQLLTNNRGLTELRLRDNYHLTDESCTIIAECCPQLLILDLTRCKGISDKGVICIAKACRFLQRLELTMCDQVTDASLTVLSKCCPDLQFVSLTATNVSTHGVSQFVQACQKLSELYLCSIGDRDSPSNRISNDVFDSLCQRSLRSAAFNSTEVTDEGVTKLVRAIGIHLKALHLHQTRVTEAIGNILVTCCPALTTLQIWEDERDRGILQRIQAQHTPVAA